MYLNTASYGLPPRDGFEAMQRDRRRRTPPRRADPARRDAGMRLDADRRRRLRLASDARRFDTSPAWFSWVGAQPALELLNRIGVDAVYAHDVALANRFRAGLGMQPSNSAIVSVAGDGAAQRLERAGIVAALDAIAG